MCVTCVFGLDDSVRVARESPAVFVYKSSRIVFVAALSKLFLSPAIHRQTSFWPAGAPKVFLRSSCLFVRLHATHALAPPLCLLRESYVRVLRHVVQQLCDRPKLDFEP